jgi:hypothetical protein
VPFSEQFRHCMVLTNAIATRKRRSRLSIAGRLQSFRKNHLPVPQARLLPSSEAPCGLSQISFNNYTSFFPLIRKNLWQPWFIDPTFYVSKPLNCANLKLTSHQLTGCYRFLSNDFKSFHPLFKRL